MKRSMLVAAILAAALLLSNQAFADPQCGGQREFRSDDEACDLFMAGFEFAEVIASYRETLLDQFPAGRKEECPAESFIQVFDRYVCAWYQYADAQCNLYCDQYGGCGDTGWDNEICLTRELGGFSESILNVLRNGGRLPFSSACDIESTDVGPSFDCTRAVTPAEKMICSNPYLSLADVRLSRIYRRIVSTSKNPESAKKIQRSWLESERDRADNPVDMMLVYMHKINSFKADDDRIDWSWCGDQR